MNVFRIAILAVAGFLLSAQALAYYCSTPAGNGYVNEGDSMSKVQQACGQPTSSTDSDKQNETTTAIQYWTYENAQVDKGTGLGNYSQQTVVRSGPSTTVEVANGKITNIMQSGSQSGSENCFSQSSIQVGGSSDDLLAACGSPTSTTTQPKTTQGPTTKITTWIYSRGQYSSPLVLTFEGGKLSQIQE